MKPITLRGPARMLKLKLTFKKPPLPGAKYLDSDIITVQKTLKKTHKFNLVKLYACHIRVFKRLNTTLVVKNLTCC